MDNKIKQLEAMIQAHANEEESKQGTSEEAIHKANQEKGELAA